MNILSFIHPVRTFLPCSGVGRHMNGVLLSLAGRPDVSLRLLFAQQWLDADGKLPENCPLRDLPFTTFPQRENRTERLWKFLNRPRMDRFVPPGTDWVYSPMDTRFPTTRCPVAITIHDVQAFETDLPWSHTLAHRRFRLRWSLWLSKAIRDSRIVFTVSEFSRRRLIELLHAPEDKVVVSGNGVDEAFLREARRLGSQPRATGKPPTVLVVGGLREKKGAAWVLAVARELKRRKSDVRFTIAGPSEQPYEAEGRELGSFDFLGWVGDDRLPCLLAGAAALLFLSPYEGFGIPAIEALAVGTPPIVADRASLPEVVGSAGYVVDPNDAGGIADLVAGLAAGTIQFDVAGGLARAASFSWDAVADRVLGALRARAS